MYYDDISFRQRFTAHTLYLPIFPPYFAVILFHLPLLIAAAMILMLFIIGLIILH